MKYVNCNGKDFVRGKVNKDDRIKSIQKIYGTGSTKFCALNNVSLSVNDGEFVSIVGKSGCGKSTLLNILGCIDNFDSGEYVFDNINVKELKGRKLALFRGRKIGYVFQKFHLIPELNLAEMLVYLWGMQESMQN